MKQVLGILFRILKWIFITILAVLLLLVIVVKVPAVHDFILRKATTYFNEKTEGNLSIRDIDLRIPSYVQLEGVSLESPDSHRIAYVGDIEISLGWRYLFNQTIHVDRLILKDVEGRIFQRDASGWNYDFIVNAFSDSTATPANTKSSSNWDFSIGYVDLQNIDIAYYDYFTGDSIHAILGNLSVDMDDFSVTQKTYQADKIALKNSAAFIRIGNRETNSSTPETNPSETQATPLNLGLKRLAFENNKILYEMGPAPDKYFFDIGKLEAYLEKLDIEKQIYRADQLALSQTKIHLKIAPTSSDTSHTPLSIFAPIEVQLAQLAIDNIDFKMETIGQPDNTILLENLGIDLRDAIIDSTQYVGNIESIEGSYNQFRALKNFSTEFEISSRQASLQDLNLQYGQSTLRANLDLKFDRMDSLISAGIFRSASIDIPQLRIVPEDIRSIVSALDIPDSAFILPLHPILLQAKVNGNTDKFTVEQFDLGTGQSNLKFTAVADGNSWLTKTYRINNLELDLAREDILPYLTGLDTNYVPPHTNLLLSGNFTTNSTDFNASVATTYGDLSLSGKGGGYAADTLPVKTILKSNNIDFASFLGMPQTFNSDIRLEATFKNVLDTNNFQLNADLKIDTLKYDKYRLHNLHADATLDSNLYSAKFLINDTFVVADFGVSGKINPGMSADLFGQIDGIDLQGLGFSKEDLRGKFNLKASYSQVDSIQKGTILINKIIFVRNERRFEFDPIEASAFLSPDSTSAHITSPLIDLNSVTNRSIDQLGMDMANTFGRTQVAVSDTSAFWNLNFKTKDNTDLRELFIPQLTQFDPASGVVDYSAEKRKIDADIQIPKIQFSSYTIDSLYIKSYGNRDLIETNLYVKHAGMDSLAIENLHGRAQTTDKGAFTELHIGADSLKPNYYVGLNLIADSVRLKNGFSLNILDSLVLNQEVWQVDPENDIHYFPKGWELKKLRVYKDNSELLVQKNREENATSISASDFDLKTLFGLIATEQPLLSGQLFGDFKLMGSGSFEGDGRVDNFYVSKADFGKLKWRAVNTNAGFDIAVNTKGGVVDFDLNGNMKPQNEASSALQLDLVLNKLDLGALPKLLPSEIFDGSGEMTGKMKIDGTTAAPQLNGNLHFENAMIGLAANGSRYSIKNQSIAIQPKAIEFNTFTVRDSSGNKLNVDGKITHDNFSKIRSDLSINASDFEIANLKPGVNENMYGKLIADAEIKINGRLDAPSIDAKIGISDKTNLSYIVPVSDYEDPFDDNLIKWTNFDSTKTTSILTRDKKKQTGKVDIYANTVDLNGSIKINKDATFRVVIDSAAGDYLEIRGGGDLGITYDRTGSLKLNGTYQIQDGFYQMTFYNIVKKKFDFQEGSLLTWNGDPMAANLDITAIYKTKASVAGLMVSGQSDQSNQTFNQRLPFEVLMHLKGNLLKPEITFDIQVASESRGAFGGAVDAKLADMRSNPNELNKQVFALLVLNTFMSSGNGSDNLVANQARNSASQILSQQLNALSSKLIKGVDLNFNLDSYGGAAGQGNTDLNVDLAKTFLNDRIVVRIGSTIALEENSSNASQASKEMMTNIAVEYKITPNGAYRFKAYRKNDFEDIIVGRITRTGVGVLFQHDFSRFHNIFKINTDSTQTANPDIQSTPEKTKEEKQDK